MEMTTKALEKKQAKPLEQAIAMTPPVDIVEDADKITLWADMPGMSRENLAVGVEGDTLTLAGVVTLGESAAMSSMYAEIDVAQYRRSFVLGRDLDKEKIEASLANGVLKLTIPKLEQARPRRIAVKAQ